MKTIFSRISCAALLLLSTIQFQLATFAQGTAFTYQGRLNDSGGPYSGSAEFQPTLWDAVTNGIQVSTNNPASVVANVTNGLFVLPLDFGNQFPGADRWLQLEVRTTLGPFTTLSPRQQVTPAPYAITASGLTGLRVQSNTNGSPNLVGGSSANFVPSINVVGATIGGGGASDFHGLIYSNSVTSSFGTVAGGGNNTAGNFSTVSGGFQNSSGGTVSTIGGGGFNLASGFYTSVGGGRQNAAVGNASTVSGGETNTASGDSTTVGGGSDNSVSNSFSTVGGGKGNAISAMAATIGGGSNNVIQSSGNYATVGGGSDNTAGGQYATVGGGDHNNASGITATVSGGSGNTATNSYSVVSGGADNTASGNSAAVVGGIANLASGGAASVGGGILNFAGSDYATISGGSHNVARSLFGFIGGGLFNTASNACSTVSGGTLNFVGAFAATVAGGSNNVIQSSANYAAIGGGHDNTASEFRATVGGGALNKVSGDSATVSGGQQNVASGLVATIPGGLHNTAAGFSSMAAGNHAQALHDGAFVWADNSTLAPFSSTAPNQFLIQAAGGVGIGKNTPSAALDVNGTINSSSRVTASAVAIGTGSPQGLFHVQANRTGSFDSSVAFAENTSIAANAAPALRVVGWGNCPNGVLSVSGNGTGLIAQFGNYNSFVASISTNGTFTGLVFSPTSDRNAKENFETVDSREVLEKVLSLPVTRWTYKVAPGEKHLGPMAQDFQAAFHVGADDKHIATVDADGVALAAIQGLNEKLENVNQRSENRIKKLEAENAGLKRELAALKEFILLRAPGIAGANNATNPKTQP